MIPIHAIADRQLYIKAAKNTCYKHCPPIPNCISYIKKSQPKTSESWAAGDTESSGIHLFTGLSRCFQQILITSSKQHKPRPNWAPGVQDFTSVLPISNHIALQKSNCLEIVTVVDYVVIN